MKSIFEDKTTNKSVFEFYENCYKDTNVMCLSCNTFFLLKNLKCHMVNNRACLKRQYKIENMICNITNHLHKLENDLYNLEIKLEMLREDAETEYRTYDKWRHLI